MKQPLVECDILVEVASDRLTAKRGDFLVVYYTDAEHRRAVAVRTFEARPNGGPLVTLERTAPEIIQVPVLPAPAKKRRRRLARVAPAKKKSGRKKRGPAVQKPSGGRISSRARFKMKLAEEATAIDWKRALELKTGPRKGAIAHHMRQAVFDANGDFVAQTALIATYRSSAAMAWDAMKLPLRKGLFVKSRENSRVGYRLAPSAGAYLDNFRRRRRVANAVLAAPSEPAEAPQS